ncbi:uncharacterized protein LOC129741392 [Uranotaenia lowii]|uniref:uncharacterized protein LOC129741392 n=1 Tax=Uranotaenia lowii TaxID=190385 RepID=UPI0024794BEF|nr:uncharacterized protein LOC129741392 [Uranotaenia lowii]
MKVLVWAAVVLCGVFRVSSGDSGPHELSIQHVVLDSIRSNMKEGVQSMQYIQERISFMQHNINATLDDLMITDSKDTLTMVIKEKQTKLDSLVQAWTADTASFMITLNLWYINIQAKFINQTLPYQVLRFHILKTFIETTASNDIAERKCSQRMLFNFESLESIFLDSISQKYSALSGAFRVMSDTSLVYLDQVESDFQRQLRRFSSTEYDLQDVSQYFDMVYARALSGAQDMSMGITSQLSRLFAELDTELAASVSGDFLQEVQMVKDAMVKCKK